MKYSYNWLQSHIEDPLPSPESLKETIIFHAFEVESLDPSTSSGQEPNDWIFDIKVLPDRAGDCLSHYGMAREIAGLLGLNFNDMAYTMPAAAAEVSIDVQTTGCTRYSAVRIDGVNVMPSPPWLVKKLEAVGQRSINNVVDATNFILLDLGQPTHAFDADKVRGSIVVREVGSDQETIMTLSDDEKTLKEGMMVIADENNVLAIAGVKGGTAAEVKIGETMNIVVEIANFDAVSVRKTSRSLGLVTDASKRFENNLAPYLVESARAKLVGLIQILAGGTVTTVGEYYPAVQTERAISFTLEDIQRVLGMTITDISIVQVLDRYGYSYEKSGDPSNTSGQDFYTMAVPLWRHDITGAHDMAEEIGRVIGYDTIPSTALPFKPTIVSNAQYEKIRAIKYALSQQGYSEVMNYSFRKKGEVSISYGPKDKSALRANLSDALKESYDMNRLNAPLFGLEEVKLFEVGTVFSKDAESVHVAVADKKGVQEWSVDEYPLENDPSLSLGISVPSSHFDAFKPWSQYPFIVRDIAVWVTSSDLAEQLKKIVTDFAQKNCVRPAVLFDTFSKDDKTSLAYRFVFQSFEKTLTDAEVETVFQTLVSDIAAENGMEIR